jgi:hypothetical protein
MMRLVCVMWKGIPRVRNNSKLEINIMFTCLTLSGSLCGTLLYAACVIGSRSINETDLETRGRVWGGGRFGGGGVRGGE